MDFETEDESPPLDEKHVLKIKAEIRKEHTLWEGGKVGQQLKALPLKDHLAYLERYRFDPGALFVDYVETLRNRPPSKLTEND